MKILQRMLLFHCIPVFLVALLFFIMILQMVDLFGNLWRYLNQEVPLATIFAIQFHYIPKCVSYSVPIALLFSVAYTLGQLYANNELIALLGSGMSLRYAVLPLLVCGLLAGLLMFRFEDRYVIPSYSLKNGLTREVLGQRESLSNTNVTIRGDAPGVIYSTEYYNDGNRTLSNVTVVIVDSEGLLQRRIDSKWAEYGEEGWVFHDARVFRQENGRIREEGVSVYRDPLLKDEPGSFRRRQKEMEELTLKEAGIYLRELEKAGLETRGPRTDYYKRIAFAFTPLIVAMISAAVGSRFRKNILLMSLLMSLGISVVFYVFQMVTGIFATIGILPPFAGAFLPVLVFFFAGLAMLQFVRT
jgi:lipopolysaccharide export system permease protein